MPSKREQSSWKPVSGRLMTRWAKDVDPACPLPEYPRPQMTRPRWVNLNGLWGFAVTPKDQSAVLGFEGRILVPFPIESALSGVGRALQPDERLWYRRTFASPLTPADRRRGSRLLLHFGAVDWAAEAWVNGCPVGAHQGGFLPFTFDLTDAVVPGENELIVAVVDPTDTHLQQRGKQVLKPKTIWYSAVSGIWQTVWLEVVPAVSIDALRLTPDLDAEMLTVEVRLRGERRAVTVETIATDGRRVVTHARGPASRPLVLRVRKPHTWSAVDPHLYDLRVRLLDGRRVVDEVGSYFAMRKFDLGRDAGGQRRFELNHKPLFLYGPLDQGYFPDGLYTAPTDAALRFDIEYAKRLGCNLIRKHVKVETARWYWHCDRLGMIVWQDMPNGGKAVGDVTSLLAILYGLNRGDRRLLGRAGRAEEANRRQFRDELKGMVEALYSAPCIAAWVPFNEGWGQFDAAEIGAWVKSLDPTRLVDDASGWFDQAGGDFRSLHIYFKKLGQPKADPNRALAITEFGGLSLRIPKHQWDAERKFGYRFYESTSELTEAYLTLLKDELTPLIDQGLAAAIYTQLADVEIEVNGYLTYDRGVPKMDQKRIAEAHVSLCRALR
jgi:beta-galactosidase/beta-glucuronidase